MPDFLVPPMPLVHNATMADCDSAPCPVPDHSVEELLRRAVRGCRDRQSRKGQKHPRWVAVMDTFALGSSYSHDLCRWAGVDPDEQVKR